jgi:DNA-binding NtrC family response regulator
MTIQETILFVDDEPAILDGYKRVLYKDFAIETAVGAEAGLALMKSHGPFPVVVSDMRMPKMNGVQFLSEVKSVAPDTVRMILTGYADVPTVMDAVNESNIFRFLTKPCEKTILGSALTSALTQYRLVVAERELLEKTLQGMVRVLADVLSFVNPALSENLWKCAF